MFKNIQLARGDMICAFRQGVLPCFGEELEINLLRGAICESVEARKVIVVVLGLCNLD